MLGVLLALASAVSITGLQTGTAGADTQYGPTGIPGGPIYGLDDVFASDQVAARDMHIKVPHPLAASGTVDLIGNPIKLSRTPVTYRRAPPVCGADTEAVLDELLGEHDRRGC